MEVQVIAIPLAIVEGILLQPEQFYSMCSQLSDLQKHFCSFIMTYVGHLTLVSQHPMKSLFSVCPSVRH